MKTKKYRFKFRQNGSICEFESWDVPEMIKQYQDWECLDDVTDLLLGDAIHAIPKRKRVKANANNSE